MEGKKDQDKKKIILHKRNFTATFIFAKHRKGQNRGESDFRKKKVRIKVTFHLAVFVVSIRMDVRSTVCHSLL